MENYEWRIINGQFARLYSTFTFGNMVIHSCFETTNVIANTFQIMSNVSSATNDICF